MENNNTPYNNFIPDIKQNNDIHANTILLPTMPGPHQQMIPQHLAHPNMYLMNVPQAHMDQYQQQQQHLRQSQHPQQGPPQQGHLQQGHLQQGHLQQGHPQQGHPQQGHPQQQQQPLPPMMQPQMILPHPYFQQHVHMIPQQQSQQSQHVQAIYPQQHLHPQPLPLSNYQALEQQRSLSSELLSNPQPAPQIRSASEQRQLSQTQNQVQVGQQNQQHPSSPHHQPVEPLDPSQFKTEKNSKRISSASSKIKHQKKVSAFVTKLYSMLHDPSLSHLIWWSRLYQNDTTTFALLPGTEFASCLTTYFKHGNVASFVRQLHMYGFHKVCEGNQQHLLQSSYDQNHTIWEFRHASGKFKRGDQNHLHLIKRRANSRRTSANPDVNSVNPEPVNTSAVDIHGEPLQPQSSVSSKEMDSAEDNNSNYNQTRVAYKPVYFTADENHENHETSENSANKKDNGKQTFRAPAPKLLKDPFDKSIADPLNRVVSPTSSSQEYPPAASFQPGSAQQPHHVPYLPRAYSPTGRLSPVSYRQNVFFQESRQRYPSVFIDPCAPAPSSAVPDRARSPPLPLPVISSQPQQMSQGFMISPRNMRPGTESNTSLPPISSISSQASVPPSPGHSISSAKSSRFLFSRNSSSTSTSASQLRPSIFDIHHASSTTNSSISAHNSIFSGSSISSNGSIGSRFGSSISSMLNEERRIPSFTNNSISSISVPITSSSLKTVTSVINDTSSSGRSETPENSAHTTSVIVKGESKNHERNKASLEPSKSTPKISELLNRNDAKDNSEISEKKDVAEDLDGKKSKKTDDNNDLNHDENVRGKRDEKVEVESK